MKMREALDRIDGKRPGDAKRVREGYCVSFEVRRLGGLQTDSFPDVDADEPGIADEEEAWALAESFARAAHSFEVVNVHVVQARDFTPVAGYERRKLNVYP